MISSSPCRVEVESYQKELTQQSAFNSELIESAKLMRQFTRIKEEAACSKCKFTRICHGKNKEPKDSERKVSLSDVINLLIGFYQRDEDSTSVNMGLYAAASSVLNATNDMLEDFELN